MPDTKNASIALPAIVVIALMGAMLYALHADLDGPAPARDIGKREHESERAEHHQPASNLESYSAAVPPDIASDSHGNVGTKTDSNGEQYAIFGWSAEWWTAAFTGALFLVTAGLWGATWFLYLTTRKAVVEGQAAIAAAQANAAAAALAARNLLRVARPLCVLDEIRLDSFTGRVPDIELPEGYFLMSLYGTIRNKGSADAFAKNMQVVSCVGAIGDPLLPGNDEEGSVFGYEQLKVGAEHSPVLPIRPIPVTDDAIKRGGLFVWGWLRYADIHGVVRRSGFAFEWWPSFFVAPGSFSKCGSDSYWYDAEEEEKSDKNGTQELAP